MKHRLATFQRNYGHWRATFGQHAVVMNTRRGTNTYLSRISDPHELTQLAICADPDGESLKAALNLCMAPGDTTLLRRPGFEIVLEVSGGEIATSFYYGSEPDEGVILNYQGQGTRFAADLYDYLGDRACRCHECTEGRLRPARRDP